MSRSACAIGRGYTIASFKGVQFACTESDAEGGRRGAEAEYPFGENTNYADLGRKIRVYHITAVFREDNHIGDSQALFSACESTGPGLLVHPTRGSFMAACRSIKLKDNSEDQGESTAELEFVEANPVSGGLAGSLFGIISSALNLASQASFLADYAPLFVASPWREDVIDTAQLLVGSVTQVAIQTLPPDAPAQMHRDILKMQEVANDDGLATQAINVDRALMQSFVVVAGNVVDPVPEFRLMTKLANVAAKTSVMPAGGAAESEEAVLSRHHILAGIGMAEAAMAIRYPSVDEALRAMDQVLAVLHDESKAAFAKCDNTLFLELEKYAIQFSQMMNELTYRLPSRIIVNFMGGVHPLVAAYVIYNDAKRHRDLEQRNVIDGNGRFKPLVVGVVP